ncbi:MAG: hypothetical protein GXP22_02930 [Gammaproteobacteria bacterium]|nr:hypothetical protein [Gammaproteobacteria bacterium]
MTDTETTFESSDEASSQIYLEEELELAEQHLQALSNNGDSVDRARVLLDKANALLGLKRNTETWEAARSAFDIFIKNEAWQDAVEACDLLYQTDEDHAIQALAHGVWLAISYPIDPQQTLIMLNYIIEDTPSDSDGAAVAAVTAHYIISLRAKDDEQYHNLGFLSTNMIAKVAKRHSNIESQELLEFWMEKLELKDPTVFLPRMSSILDVIIGHKDNWWFNRDALREKLPVN